MEGKVSSDETSVLANSTRNISRPTKDSEIYFDTLAPSAKIKIKKGENLFHKKPSRKRKGNHQKRQMNTQILSKNELVINAEEEEEEEEEEARERKQTKNKWTW